jgi:hypothetical protein
MSDDLGASVRARLGKTSQVTKYVGSRIYEDVLEQGAAMPAIVVSVDAGSPEEDLSSDVRLFHPTVEILAFANDRSTANALAKTIRDSALAADLRGEIEGMVYLDVSLTSGPTSLVDQPTNGSDQWRRITKQVFTIWASPT